MRIMHLCLCGPYSDKYEYQDNLLPQKHYEMGYDVEVLVSQETWESDGRKGLRAPQSYINSTGYTIKVIPFSKGPRAVSFRLFNGLYDEIQKFKPDILFCHGGLTFSYRDIIKYLDKNKGVRFYLDSHVDYNISGIDHVTGLSRIRRYYLYKYIWGHCVRVLSKYARKVWGVTPARVDFLNEVFMVPKEKIDLLVMGADEKKIDISKRLEKRKKLRESLNIGETTILLMTGGKLDKYKNIPQLLDAMSVLQDEDVHLAIFGSPSEDMVNEINKKAKLLNNVSMLGWADADQITDFFLGADIAIFPGRHSVLWEKAVACGLPCIILKAAGMEHVDVGGNCIFYEGNSSDVIVDIIRKTIKNPKCLEKMREVALNNGVKEFSYDHIARKSIEMGE